MKKSEAVSLYNGIHAVMGLVGVIFGYALNKNLSILKPEIEALQKVATPPKEFLEFDEKRVAIVKKYAKKDDKGEFVVKDNQYDVAENKEVVEKEVSTLREENKSIVEAHDKQMAEYNALLDQETNIELYKVKLENVPKDITAAQMKEIYLIIEE